ncbi:putative manganese catalase [Adhaeribacter pallidiroseus]|uniref:Putative manganese catalase n=1 Tax=Adhaeribacter pallidiroseus TaxID=2072847 RepID=A0A369QHX6_9BACT|nr:putative manganese catalase [Adhaeribacter pallidiroseus]
MAALKENSALVYLRYLFQAWGTGGPVKYRDMLLETSPAEIGHIKMLATAVALNLEGAPMSLKIEMAKDSVIVCSKK